MDMPVNAGGSGAVSNFETRSSGVTTLSFSQQTLVIQRILRKLKVYTEIMEGPNPKWKIMKMRMTTEIKDKDELLWKMYSPGEDGKEVLMMEISYTRKK